jgi:hypothetical protein
MRFDDQQLFVIIFTKAGQTLDIVVDDRLDDLSSVFTKLSQA